MIKYDLKNDYSLVSVFLTNKRPFSNELASIMFQAKLEVFNEDGFVSESYARNNNSLDEYYYLEKPIFARGRGCAEQAQTFVFDLPDRNIRLTACKCFSDK